MELRHLKYFVTVAENLNFSHAANRLYISQPALSRQIKDLEDELGILLFERKSHGLAITEAGKFFLEHAKDILNVSQMAVQTVKAHYSNTDEALSIGYIPTILQSLLGENLHRFKIAYPQIAIRFYEMPPSEQVKALREGAIDIAFMGNPPDELKEEFIIKCVKKISIVAVLPNTHPLAHQNSINLAELASEKFIGMCEQKYPRQNARIYNICRSAGFVPNLYLFADSHLSIIALIATGQGVSVMSNEAEALPHPQVSFVPLHHPIDYEDLAAVWRKDTLSKSLEKYLKILFENV